MSEPAFRSELAHWMRTTYPVRDDGMPGYALGLSERQSVVGPRMVRTFDIGTSQAAKDEELSRWSALLAVIVTSLPAIHSCYSASAMGQTPHPHRDAMSATCS